MNVIIRLDVTSAMRKVLKDLPTKLDFRLVPLLDATGRWLEVWICYSGDSAADVAWSWSVSSRIRCGLTESQPTAWTLPRHFTGTRVSRLIPQRAKGRSILDSTIASPHSVYSQM